MMNPLETLLNDALIRTSHVSNGCLMNRLDEGKIIASTHGFTLTASQIDSVMSAFSLPSSIRENDFEFGSGRKFECIRADKEAIYVVNDKSGIIIMQTENFIVLGTYNEHMYPAVCIEAVEKLCQYFKAKGK